MRKTPLAAAAFIAVAVTQVPVSTAEAGPIRWLAQTVGQKWTSHQASRHAARESYREIGRLEARRAATSAAQRQASRELTKRAALEKAGKVLSFGGLAFTSAMLGGAIAKAGHEPNPVPFEQRHVEKELALAAANGATIYRARVCLHPETGEFYTVPKWAKVCSDGKPVRQGNAIDLEQLRRAAKAS